MVSGIFCKLGFVGMIHRFLRAFSARKSFPQTSICRCWHFEMQLYLKARINMSKYEKLWIYVKESGKGQFKLSYQKIEQITGVAVDHSFLSYKKELAEFGYQVGKISMKEQTIEFIKDSFGESIK